MISRKTKRKLVNIIAGKKRYQKFFETLLYMSYRVLNYNNGGDISQNGELHLLKQIREKYKGEKSIVIFDVGANSGHYSEGIAEIFGDKSIIYAFEPSLETYKVFIETTKNIKNIIPNNIGLSDKEGTLLLHTPEQGSTIASVYKRNLDHYGIDMNQNEEIKLSTVDKYCQDKNIDKIDFLKIDVEGHELSVLHGAKRMLSEKRIEHIQFEFGGTNIDSRTFFQDFFYLLKDNYRIYRILKDGLSEIESYNESLEVFYLINFVAIKRS
ncbi:FkbM family methyltransferase [Dysgonomonas sp. OttesenSCG-928-M03]|nr:FkbM family methyltransferase [Dysgonomonas sp. OttesenSCG-928-M03]